MGSLFVFPTASRTAPKNAASVKADSIASSAVDVFSALTAQVV